MSHTARCALLGPEGMENSSFSEDLDTAGLWGASGRTERKKRFSTGASSEHCLPNRLKVGELCDKF